MDVFLAILMVLGIFVVLPAIIAFTYIGVVSGLFRVVKHRAYRRITAVRRKAARAPEEAVLEEVTQQ